MTRRSVQLIHWKAGEVPDRVDRLEKAGCNVSTEPFAGPPWLKNLAADPPAAIVIDLTRAPAQGRDVAVIIRQRKSTRHIPLVLVGGEPAKVKRIQSVIPDAIYCTWRGIKGGLKKAISHPPIDPVSPDSAFAGYAGKPLPEKLGIKKGHRISLIGAPKGFEKILGRLPTDTKVSRRASIKSSITLWFVTSSKDLDNRIEKMGSYAQGKSLWIIWPKKGSAITSDLNQNIVRQTGLASGLVDFKVCRVDETWAGLRFTRRP